MKSLLESVLKHANNVMGKEGETTESVVLKLAAEQFGQEVMKCGEDAGKMKVLFAKNSVRIQAITEAVEKGTDLAETIVVPTWKSEQAAATDGGLGATLAKAIQVLSGVATGTAVVKTEDAVGKTDDPAVECKACLWKGASSVLKSGLCPECGAVLKAETVETKTGFEKAKDDLLKSIEVGGDDDVLKGLKAKCGQLLKTEKGSKDESLKKADEQIDRLLKGEDIEDGWPRDMQDDVAKDDNESVTKKKTAEDKDDEWPRRL